MIDKLTLPVLFALLTYLLVCGFFQCAVITIEFYTNSKITKRNEKMVRRISIAFVLLLLISCTVVYLKSSDDNEIKIDEQQGLAPIDAKINLEANETQTKNKKKDTQDEQ